MQTLELESPGLEQLEELKDQARKNFQKTVIGGGEPEDPDISVELYLLGLNRRASGYSIDRIRPDVTDPYLMVAFRNITHEDFREMASEFRNENADDLRDLHNRFQQTMGDYQIFLEEYFGLLSEGELDTDIYHVPAEVGALHDVLDDAGKLERSLRQDDDYNVNEARFMGGVERESLEEALDDLTPTITFEITYSGSERALEEYNDYLENYTPMDPGAEAIPGTVYIGKEAYPRVVFNGPMYLDLEDGELERQLWGDIE